MTIGQMARRSGLTPRAIRYYEQVGLVPRPSRTDRNYRIYDKEALERLRFIARCRSLGFSLSEIRALCGTTEAQTWICAQVENVVRQHVDLTEEKIGELLEIRGVLAEKLAQCSGERTPACKHLELIQ